MSDSQDSEVFETREVGLGDHSQVVSVQIAEKTNKKQQISREQEVSLNESMTSERNQYTHIQSGVI